VRFIHVQKPEKPCKLRRHFKQSPSSVIVRVTVDLTKTDCFLDKLQEPLGITTWCYFGKHCDVFGQLLHLVAPLHWISSMTVHMSNTNTCRNIYSIRFRTLYAELTWMYFQLSTVYFHFTFHTFCWGCHGNKIEFTSLFIQPLSFFFMKSKTY